MQTDPTICAACGRPFLAGEAIAGVYPMLSHMDCLNDTRRLILRAAEIFNVSTTRIMSGSRQVSVVSARCAIAAILRTWGMTLEEIGDVLQRDHTTVIHQLALVSRRRMTDTLFARRLAYLERAVTKYEASS